jgi:hypothetical protein
MGLNDDEICTTGGDGSADLASPPVDERATGRPAPERTGHWSAESTNMRTAQLLVKPFPCQEFGEHSWTLGPELPTQKTLAPRRPVHHLAGHQLLPHPGTLLSQSPFESPELRVNEPPRYSLLGHASPEVAPEAPIARPR